MEIVLLGRFKLREKLDDFEFDLLFGTRSPAVSEASLQLKEED